MGNWPARHDLSCWLDRKTLTQTKTNRSDFSQMTLQSTSQSIIMQTQIPCSKTLTRYKHGKTCRLRYPAARPWHSTNMGKHADSDTLQQDLDTLQTWENMWDMDFNPSKCQVLHTHYKHGKTCGIWILIQVSVKCYIHTTNMGKPVGYGF